MNLKVEKPEANNIGFKFLPWYECACLVHPMPNRRGLCLDQVHAQGNEADSVSAPRTNPQGFLSSRMKLSEVSLSNW
jgi:hypothetical protein